MGKASFFTTDMDPFFTLTGLEGHAEACSTEFNRGCNRLEDGEIHTDPLLDYPSLAGQLLFSPDPRTA